MKIWCFVLNFSILLQFSVAFFDIEELKTFNYGIDIRSEPVAINPEEPVEENFSVVKLTSKYGQLYQCTFPNTVEQEKQKGEAEKVAMETGIPDLLKPMESGPCLRKTKDWWSYEFCYGKNIKQFHVGEDGQIEGQILMLGYYESEFNWDAETELNGEPRENKMRRYHTQQYVNGTKCDLNSNLRKTEVRFVCEESGADYIARLDEPATCSYVMTIHTMKICHHPFLKPPTPTQTLTISCNPLLTDRQFQQYQDDLKAQEEERRLEEERLAKEEEEKIQLEQAKAKYYRQNQNIDKQTDDGEGNIEVEDEDLEQSEDPLGADNWQTMYKIPGGNGDGIMGQGMMKVVKTQEDLNKFLNDAMEDVYKSQTVKTDSVDDDDEEDDGRDIKAKGPKRTTKQAQHDDEENEELEELTKEIKTLKDKYKTRRLKLTEFKKKVKANMEAQYASIVKEAQDELAQEGIETDIESQENRNAIRQLTKTIDDLLDKMDRTEKEIEAVDKELEQFAEYDTDEKVKSIPPVKEPVEPVGPDDDDIEDTENRVKVKVSRIKLGDDKRIALDDKHSALSNKETEFLEKGVQKELEKAGLKNADKIQVKIITTSYGNDDELHDLSKEESQAILNMLVDFVRSPSEMAVEQARQDQQEENYSYVYGQSKPIFEKKDSSDIDSLMHFGDEPESNTFVESEKAIYQKKTEEDDSYLNKEDEDL